MESESVLNRLRQELDQIGDRVSSAFELGRLQVEKVRLTSLRKDVAAELGLMVHQQERGTSTEADRYQALLERLDDLQGKLDKVEREMSAERATDVVVTEEPPATDPDSGPAKPAHPTDPAA